MKSVRSNAPDIVLFNKNLREVLYELQRKTAQLDNLEKELLLARSELCTKTSLLQTEEKISGELRTRLKITSDTINRLEEEKMRDSIERSNLSTSYEIVSKERDELKKEVLFFHTEASKYKFNVDSLEYALRRETQQREKLEQALTDFKNENEKVVANVDLNIEKLSKEQKYLMDSAMNVIQFNKRLQTYGLCSYAINKKYKEEIKHLQNKLLALSPCETSNQSQLHPEIENLRFKLKEMLAQLKARLRDSAPFEDKLNHTLDELSIDLTKIQN
ncbi:uncharacterized protein LOC108623315 [Ceratina calcarata]|uniref:Uncharacterized protein LOC108623315 n=1 Tax=Ceratina calcarata TaxID=156304 RepID=A0AAJ7IUE4_9HYME|nr:uncharacterized protein LOC108623315 [Ceratina calcarata]